MPGRGNAGRKERGPAGKGREDDDPGGGQGLGRSESSPGHLKKAAGAQSAREFAPGHGGQPPGRQGRDAANPDAADQLDRETLG